MRQERVFFTVLFITITVLAVIVMQPFLTYIVLAAILTYTLFPVYRFFHQRTGGRNWLPLFRSSSHCC